MRSTPVKVNVLSQDRVVQVVAGADHSMHMAADQSVTLDPRHDGTETADSAEYIAVLSSWLAALGLVGN